MDKIILPNFFIVGVGKGGTTSLYKYLSSHPDIYMSPIKEPNYFAKDLHEFHDCLDIQIPIKEFKDYISLFKGARGKKAIGEASVSYLYSNVAPLEIKRLIPNAKIIIILRNPIERALSHFLMNLRDGLIVDTCFCKAIQKRPLYLKLGLYAEHIEKYCNIFGEDNMLILFYEDLKENPKKLLKKIFLFLEVSPEFLPKNLNKWNVSYEPRSLLIHRLVMDMRESLKFFPKPLRYVLKAMYTRLFMKEKSDKYSFIRECKGFLIQYYEDEIYKLSMLTRRDLNHWLKL